MNKVRCIKIAQWLEEVPSSNLKFNIGRGLVFTECETVCCIAGAAVLFFQSNLKDLWVGDLSWREISWFAQKLLEITSDEAFHLFTPWNYEISNDPADFNNRKWAARTIRRFVETGEVNWKAALIEM